MAVHVMVPDQEAMVDKQSTCLIPCSKLFKTIRKVIIALKFIRGCKHFQHYFVRMLRPKQELMVKVGLKTLDTQRQMDEDALLDCGATGLFMDTKWAKSNFISMTELEYTILFFFFFCSTTYIPPYLSTCAV